ncbi:MAG: LysE family translocator [Chitinophagales bacterium]
MNLIWDGIVLGFLLSIGTGPVFLALVELGITKGFRAGCALAAGVWLSDMIYITLVYQGLSFIAQTPDFQWYVGLIGGLILVGFGVQTVFSKPKPLDKTQITASNYLGYFFKGAAINVFNPFIFVFWVGIVSNLAKQDLPFWSGIVYFSIILVTVAMTDVFKVYLAKSLRPFIRPKQLFWMRTLTGSGLALFGLALMYQVWVG